MGHGDSTYYPIYVLSLISHCFPTDSCPLPAYSPLKWDYTLLYETCLDFPPLLLLPGAFFLLLLIKACCKDKLFHRVGPITPQTRSLPPLTSAAVCIACLVGINLILTDLWSFGAYLVHCNSRAWRGRSWFLYFCILLQSLVQNLVHKVKQ